MFLIFRLSADVAKLAIQNDQVYIKVPFLPKQQRQRYAQSFPFLQGPVPPKVEVSTKTLLEETSSTDAHAGERATHTACSNCDSTSSAPAAALCQCRQRRRSTSQLGRCSRPLSHCDDCDGCTCHTGPLQKELQARSKSCCSHTRSR